MSHKSCKRVVVTGGSGQIAYSLLFSIARGELFGPDCEVILHILDITPLLKNLKGVVMELQDCAFPLLKEVIYGDNPKEIFKDVDLALLVGSKPRGPGMERKDLLIENGDIFRIQGEALNESASKDVKVLVVGNPCNSNAWILQQFAPSIDKSNIHALMRLDQNRARGLLAEKTSKGIGEVSPVVIWGNHSATQVPDVSSTKIGSLDVRESLESNWLENEFTPAVQKRGAAIIEARGKSSAASAAHAIIDAARDLIFPSPQGYYYSSAMLSDNNPYGIAEGIVFSAPCRTNSEGKIEWAEEIQPDPLLKDALCKTQEELISEKQLLKKNLGLNNEQDL